MFLSPFARGIFFVSSYIPLYVIFIILNFGKPNTLYLNVFFVSLIGISGFLLWLVFEQVKHVDGDWKTFTNVENVNKINLEYFVAYLLPFLTTVFVEIRQDIALLVLFAIMGIMYVKSDSIYMNPVLTIFGLNIYKVSTNSEEFIVISRHLDKNETKQIKRLTSGVFVRL